MSIQWNRSLVLSITGIAGFVLAMALLIGGSVAWLGAKREQVASLELEIETKTGSLRPQELTDEYISSLQEMESAVLHKSKNPNGSTFISMSALLTRRLVEDPIRVVMPPSTAA